MRDPRSILITGASSGIGEALAMAYAGPGVFLALIGRDRDRLEAVSAACRQRGAEARDACIDVTDAPGLAAWLRTVDLGQPLDLVIANAGVSAGTARGLEDAEQTQRIFAINVDGVFNTVMPVIPAMAARRRGQIAIMSSLASFRGLPGAPAYCASKAAVRVWGEALRAELAPQGIGVSVICPGFVISRITASNDFRMPLLMPAERSARIIIRGLARNRGRIAFPWPMYLGTRLLAALPDFLIDPLLQRAPRKA
jgi:short-subunit dehydrogenase